VKTADWVIIEFIRIYHALSLEEAQATVETLATRTIPEVWEINGKKRILKKGLDYKDKVLLLTYNEVSTGTAVEDLFDWVEYSNLSVFKKNVLGTLHSEGLIEFDKELDYVHLSPLGIKEVEDRILTHYKVSIVRIVRDGPNNIPSVLSNADIKAFWKDPVLKFSSIIDGLFHESVIVCESDGDCRFFSTLFHTAYQTN
jgi:hypothetical protein